VLFLSVSPSSHFLAKLVCRPIRLDENHLAPFLIDAEHFQFDILLFSQKIPIVVLIADAGITIC
jgi:hypothetical protein